MAVDSLKDDNQLFARNNAKFLRRLLRIAGEKEETLWYVKKVFEDKEAVGVLKQSAPRDEVQYYEALARQGGGSGYDWPSSDSDSHIPTYRRKDSNRPWTAHTP
eukprot:TRINITY_DN46582_c0_g1_i1.p1 TRINITY_DN46582_c0_g1~~TRINITY_DN46582_c0_g1_i1.p1  ORF type:complete len:119 (+),score=27.11 TRINITY_DN46582_c0_g1_i1:46-357(+)